MVVHGDGDKPLALTEYGWADGGARAATSSSPRTVRRALVYALTRRLADLRLELGIDSIYDFYWNDQPAGQEHRMAVLRRDGPHRRLGQAACSPPSPQR